MRKDSIVQLSLNEEELRELYLLEVKKVLENIEMETMLIGSKQLCKMLDLSWPTVEKLFLSDPEFPKIRVGKKWSFNRKEVQEYIDKWFKNVKKQGGSIDI
jgi:predicted DNA-binding transcriptional regulator AlpA